MVKALILSACLAGFALPVGAAELRAGEARVTTIFDHPLPGIPGKSLRGVPRRVRAGRVLPRPQACALRLHHRDGDRGRDPQPHQRRA